MVKVVSYIIDSSIHSINGDFAPTVLLQEIEACQLLFRQNVHSSGESLASVVSMGRKAQLACPLTEDPELMRETLMRIQSDSLYPIEPPAFSVALRIALLSLQHRPTKTVPPAIVLFLCSPLSAHLDKDDAAALGKMLSDEGVDVTFYVFGDHATDNMQVLQHVVDAALTGSNRINATITHVQGASLYDFLNSYATLLTIDGADAPYMDYDDENDAELLLALELSRREAEEAARRNLQANSAPEPAAATEPAPPTSPSKGKDGRPSIFGIEGEEQPVKDGGEESKSSDSIDSDDLAKDLDAMDNLDTK